MENNKKYLTEENYEKGKKSLFKIMIAVLVIGLLIGFGLIIGGIVSINSSDSATDTGIQTNVGQEQETDESNVRTEEEIDADILIVTNEINTINQELNSLKMQQTQEFMNGGFSNIYYQLQSEIDNKNSELTEKTLEKQKLEYEKENRESGLNSDEMHEAVNGIFNSAAGIIGGADKEMDSFISKGIGSMLIVGGIGVIGFTVIISLVLFLVYKKREISAFAIQQSMPIVKEGIDEMAPTIGNATKEVAKGISSGIKEGLKEEK